LGTIEIQSPTALSTPVIFTAATDTLLAKYKGHLISSIGMVAENNNQRKIMMDNYGNYHMVYASGGEIWYTKSTDGGATWSPEEQLSDGTGANANPSLYCETGGSTDYVRVVWVDAATTTCNYRDSTYNHGSGQESWNSTQQVLTGGKNAAAWMPVVTQYGWVACNHLFGSGGSITLAARSVSGTWNTTTVPGSDSQSCNPAIVAMPESCYVVYGEGSNGTIQFNTAYTINDSTFTWGTTTNISNGCGHTSNAAPSMDWDSQLGYMYAAWHGWDSTTNENEIVVRRYVWNAGWGSTFQCFGSGLPSSPTPPSFYNPVVRALGSNYNMLLTWWSSDNTIRAARYITGYGWGAYNLGVSTAQKVTISNQSNGTTGKYLYITNSSAPYQLTFATDSGYNPWTLATANQSTIIGGTQNNNQRKLYYESSSKLHEVFESGGEVFYRQSTNGGSSWQYTTELSSGSGGNSAPCITMIGSYPTVVWQQTIGSNYDLLVIRSTNDGSSWGTPAFLQSNFACTSPGPLPTVSGYSTGAGFISYRTSSGLSFSKTTNSGGAWTTPAAISGTSEKYNQPSSAMYTTYWSSDQANIAYASDSAAGSPQIYSTYYAIEANTWGTLFNLTSIVPSRYTQHANPCLAVTSNTSYKTVHVVWDAYDTQGEGRVIIHDKGTFESFGSTYSVIAYESQYKPSITGNSSDSAWVVFQNSFGTGTWKAHYYYTGSIWQWGYQSYISTGYDPSLSVGSVPAKYLWIDGSGTPYQINNSSETLSKPADAGPSSWAYSRELNVFDPASGANVTFEIGTSSLVRQSVGSTNLSFSVTPSDSILIGVGTLMSEGAIGPFSLGVDADSITIPFSVSGHLLSQLLQNGTGSVSLQLVNNETGAVVATFGTTDLSTVTEGAVNSYMLSVGIGAFGTATPSQFTIRPVINGLKNSGSFIASVGHVYRGQNVPAQKVSVTLGRTPGSQPKPMTYELSQCYPNPFNPTTEIRYALPTSGYVVLKVFDVTGREVSTLVNGNQQAGYKSVKFDASNLPSGVYYYRLQAGNFTDVKKLVVMK
jgi:hypothetical protein